MCTQENCNYLSVPEKKQMTNDLLVSEGTSVLTDQFGE